jgi:hypothetical protein
MLKKLYSGTSLNILLSLPIHFTDISIGNSLSHPYTSKIPLGKVLEACLFGFPNPPKWASNISITVDHIEGQHLFQYLFSTGQV